MVTLIDRLEDRKTWELTFDLGAFSQQGRRMIVAGSFNGWATRVRRVRSGFVAAGRKDNFVKLVLPAGDYEYKYYDLAKGEWMEDSVFALYPVPWTLDPARSVSLRERALPFWR